MSLKEQDIVFTDKDADGNTVIQMPITRIENVEGGVSSVNNVTPDANGNVVLQSEFNGDSRTNVITSTANDTTAKWKSLGGGTYWFTQASCLNNQPQQYGFVINYVAGGDIFQIWSSQNKGPVYYRQGNNSGWGNSWTQLTDVNSTKSFVRATKSTSFTASYDCIAVFVHSSGSENYQTVTINGTAYNLNSHHTGKSVLTFPLKAGDVVTCSNIESVWVMELR